MSRDLMRTEDIRDIVRDAYRDVSGYPREMVCKLYNDAELAQIPESAIARSLGVANHMRHAEIEPGQTVVDLGCGGGIDSILAARKVGPTGRVYALDFLPEMLERTAAAAADADVSDVVVPLEGSMEQIPLPDDSVDHIVSNGVINLSPRKGRVFAECARVLRPGGKFCVSDLVIVEEDLPPEVLTHPAAWAG